MEALAVELAHPGRTVDVGTLERLARRVFAEEGREPGDVTIVLSDHAHVLALNQEFLEHDYHTDVLSFPLHDAPEGPVEGEVYVDLDTAAERHAEFGTSFEREVQRYVVHGLLHLLGYDDATPAGKQTMRTLEDRYLDAGA